MEAAICATTPLDHIDFHIVPCQNRYEAWVCYENKKEKVSSGFLEHLILHSDEIKVLHSKGSNANYKLFGPENSLGIEWFTKSTLIRFLHLIGSANILDVTISLKNEICQLEEARKFHLSLYAKGDKYSLESVQSDDIFSEGTGSTMKVEGSDASKNELLRAMDVRLTALREELTTAFDQAAGSTYSVEEMTDIHRFSQHFGSEDLSESLRTYIELRQGDQPVANTSSIEHFSKNNIIRSKEVKNSTDRSLSSEMQGQYGVSPARVAEVERRSFTESNESSFSSDEDRQPSSERSRTLIRSGSPRRSASPMRRVQIGRSGSRRSTAITIKSLNYFPAREKSFFSKDDSGEELEKAPKKSEHKRMSVQDAINLFESKQRDQREDTQKAKSISNANKSVLRRWSSGMGDESSRILQDSSAVQGTEVQTNVDDSEVRFSSPDFEDYPNKTCEKNVIMEPLENRTCSPVLVREEPHPTLTSDINEKPNASAEWGRQKEAELNELFMKMMETKPVKSRTVLPATNKRQSLPSETDEKLKIEAARKRTEKKKQSKSTQEILDVKKSKPTSINASDDGKKHDVKKVRKPQKSTVSQPANPKTEKSSKLGIGKKDSPKTSSLLVTRKSWPSIPSARDTGLSPAKTRPPTSSTNSTVTPIRRRSQTPPPAVSHSSSKSEKTQMQANSVKSNPNDSKKILKIDPVKKSTKPTKAAKSNVVRTAPKDLVSSIKPKVNKKSSVVPLESKSFLRKGSKTSSDLNPTLAKKASRSQEPLRSSEDLTLTEVNVTSFNSSEPVTHQEERETEDSTMDDGRELGPTRTSPQKCEDEGFSQIIIPITDEAIVRLVEPELESEAEDDLTISSRAWAEIEENEDEIVTSVDRNGDVVGSSEYIAPVEVSSPRIRQSFSRMLLEESSEPDFFDRGNAENPRPMVHQKDAAPKGLKRLLKFARKSKNEAVFSEMEDDGGGDYKLTSKRSAERKATLSSMNGHQKSSDESEHEHHPAQSNISKSNAAQSLSQPFQQGQVSASVITTKATRSFFSLSAFKGSK